MGTCQQTFFHKIMNTMQIDISKLLKENCVCLLFLFVVII